MIPKNDSYHLFLPGLEQHLGLLLIWQQSNDLSTEILVRPDCREWKRLAHIRKDDPKGVVLRYTQQVIHRTVPLCTVCRGQFADLTSALDSSERVDLHALASIDRRVHPKRSFDRLNHEPSLPPGSYSYDKSPSCNPLSLVPASAPEIQDQTDQKSC